MSAISESHSVDPATSDEAGLARVRLLPPRELFYVWERQQWSAGGIDFSRDREQWQDLEHRERDELLWSLSQFFVGEERVTQAFSPIVVAAEDQDEEAYLASQQVDEARHTQFFARFWDEVIDGVRRSAVERMVEVRSRCNDAFAELFDDRLERALDRLRADAGDVAAKVEAITIYHMVIEGTLALTGQHFNADYLAKRDLCPGFREGFANVARDEHRHVGYGTWFLQRKCADDGHRKLMASLLEELVPLAASVLVPPAYEGQAEYEVLGYSSAELHEFALSALTRRMKVIGVPLPIPA